MSTPREPIHWPLADEGVQLLPLLSLGPLTFAMYVENLAILPGTVPVWPPWLVPMAPHTAHLFMASQIMADHPTALMGVAILYCMILLISLTPPPTTLTTTTTLPLSPGMRKTSRGCWGAKFLTNLHSSISGDEMTQYGLPPSP